ncbi:Fanconi anemia group I protein [Heracleum sosnowskyi]|uniref:Fanconi anemia group I protein n=1 Tax=Heracleum sosnowskyi TaxID=360622 RepID=A0AAD8MP49_9APIA|nr:Fanconi anemia group I protein [Heracleum sosnowskyi]
MTTTTTTPLHPPPLTATEIIALAQTHPHTHPLPTYLLSPFSHQTLISLLHSLPSSQISLYTSSLLSLLPLSPSLSSLLPSLLHSYISLLLSHSLPRDRASFSTLQLFLSHLDTVPVPELINLSELIVSSLSKVNEPDDAQVLDILPNCLDLIYKSNERRNVDRIIDKVILSEWSKGVLVKIVSVVYEFRFLSKERCREFVDKVFDEMGNVELQDLPSLVYQLLVLASKGFCKRELIEGILVFFGCKLGEKVSSIIRQVEGTVLLHVNFAVKQDPSLGQELIGILKGDVRVFNYFVVAVLLSVARIRRFNDSAMAILKTTLANAYKDCKFAEFCKWLPTDLKEEYLQIALVLETAILRAVSESNYGREHIVPSIVRFGFVLLESVDEGSQKELCKSHGLMGSQKLGMQMLKSLFEVHDMARSEIIEQCKFRILSAKPDQSLAIIRLLCRLVQCNPYPMLEYVSHLKELLDYFTFMNGKVAIHLVAALIPLVRLSRDLLDYTILVVRKAMFRREDSVLEAATSAIMKLILAEKKAQKNVLNSFEESSSQASCSQQAEVPYGIGGGLFQEFNGLLQRSLYRQAKVKEIIYDGFVELILVDPSISGSVFDFLLPHFLQFYKEDAEIQLKINQCVKLENGKFCIQEPLDCLLSCVSWILVMQPFGKSDPSDARHSFGFSLTQEYEAGRNLSGETFSSALSKIRKFLRTANIEEFLGHTQDAASAQVKEEKKYCAWILSGILEVVVNIITTEFEKATDVKKVDLEKELLEHADVYASLERFFSSGTGIKRGTVRSTATPILDKPESGRTNLFKERTLLATTSISHLFQIALGMYKSVSNSTATSQNHSQSSSRNPSIQCFKLLLFALNASLRLLKSFSAAGKDDKLKNLVYGEMKLLSSPMLKLIWFLKLSPNTVADHLKTETKGRKDSEDRKELFHLALVCLRELITIALQFPEQEGIMVELVLQATLESGSEDVSDVDLVVECEVNNQTDDQTERSIYMFIQLTIKPIFSELLAASFFQEIEILCDITMSIGTKLSGERRRSVGDWALHICKSCDVKNSKIAKSVLNLVFLLSPSPNDLVVAEDVAKELLKLMGSDTSSPLTKSETYPLIQHSTETVVASSVLHMIELIVVDMDWFATKLKSYLAANQKGIMLDENDRQAPALALEEIFYMTAEAIVKVLSPFLSMSLKDPQAEHLLRVATRFYKNLARISKLQIAPKGCKPVLPSHSYQKLVEITCKDLTAPLYRFVEVMQQQESARKGILNKIKRENRCIPELIFQIEDYEKYLILLTKASKINLLRHAKRSTSRDFRLKQSVGKEGAEDHLDENNDDSAAEAAEDDDATEEPEDKGHELDELGSPVADDSVSDGENGHSFPSAKRAKTTNTVQDSDDEA